MATARPALAGIDLVDARALGAPCALALPALSVLYAFKLCSCLLHWFQSCPAHRSAHR